MRYTDMADELFGADTAPEELSGVRLATMRRGGVTVTRVEIARAGAARPGGGMSPWKYPTSACWTSGTAPSSR